MSVLDWQWPLEDGETLLWEGRPAPRCYTFRNWKLALAGVALFLACSFWLMLGYQLVEVENHSSLLMLIPIPLVLFSFFIGPGQLLIARHRWEKIFYALTDQQVLVRDGLFSPHIRSFPSDQILNWQQKKYSEQLASIRILFAGDTDLIFHCLEQPQNLLQHLPAKQPAAVDSGESV